MSDEPKCVVRGFMWEAWFDPERRHRIRSNVFTHTKDFVPDPEMTAVLVIPEAAGDVVTKSRRDWVDELQRETSTAVRVCLDEIERDCGVKVVSDPAGFYKLDSGAVVVSREDLWTYLNGTRAVDGPSNAAGMRLIAACAALNPTEEP